MPEYHRQHMSRSSPFQALPARTRRWVCLLLHLLQISLVYINTCMIQQVLAEPTWQGRLPLTDLRALTPLKWLYVNPYGTFILHMHERLPLAHAA